MIKKLGMGVTIRDGQLEFDIPTLLKASGWEDTEENRDKAVEIAERAARVAGLITSRTKILHRHKHLCPQCSKAWPHDGKRKKCKLGKYAYCSVCSS